MPLSIQDSMVASRLKTRRRERDRLLEQARTLLEQDGRVVAAWLFGSLGRGTEDDLSDLDLFVVVDDAHAEAVIADRYAHIHQLGTPLLILEAPQNRPPHGAYNMALYAGEWGPHQVDWYWQPRAHAGIPQQTRLLFDHVGLPHLDGPPQFEYQPVPERERNEICTQTVNFFWVMLLIATKYLARAPDSDDVGLLNFVISIYEQVRQLTEPISNAVPSVIADLPAAPSRADKLHLLRLLAADVQAGMPAIARSGAQVPDAILPAATRYLDLIEMVVQATPA